MKLYNIYKNLIVEVASIDDIVNSIKQKKRVIVYYDGDEPGGKGLRIIEPVCYGYSKAGNPVLRAWDLEGASHRAYLGEKPLASWRMFRVDKIINYKPTLENFNEMRPGYNPSGDKSMTRVIINAVFDNQQQTENI
jgi:predicted DNA-binding transcriptional regulator YafY